MQSLQGSILNLFPSNVAIDCYVLGSFIENRISSNVKSSLVVTKQNDRMSVINVQVF